MSVMDKTGKLMINSGTIILPHDIQEIVKEKNKKSQSEIKFSNISPNFSQHV